MAPRGKPSVDAVPRRRRVRALAQLTSMLLSAATASAGELEAAPEGLSATDIAVHADHVLRGERTFMEATMTVESPRLGRPRSVRFRSWDDRGGKRSLIRIDEPAKDAGTGFLKLHPNLWMYIPRVERTLRIPPSMMLQPWMGSDFNNDDLVNESSDIEDYDHRVLGIDPATEGTDGVRAFVIEYIPHDDAPVVWGKIVGWIDTERKVPLRQEFFDEAGVKLRVMRFEDIRMVGTRPVPHLWEMTPLDKEGHRTRIQVHRFSFDADIDDAFFTTRQLKKRD